jgi:ParB family chromosome partitioning protein
VIIHGERRWRAARLAGLEAIPALVRDIEGRRVLLQQLMENIVREDLNALDRAQALRALKEQMDNAPWDRVADAVGIRRSRLFQLLGTEKLSDGFRELLREGVVSEKQTRAVQRLPEEVQEELAGRLRDGTLAPGEIEIAARTVKDASTAEEARALLRLAAIVDIDPARTARFQAARRQTRRLAKEIDALGTEPLPDELKRDFIDLAQRIQALLRRTR